MTRMRLTYISTERWRELASLAIQAGASRPHVSTIEWDVCGDGRQRCLDPYQNCLVWASDLSGPSDLTRQI